MKYFRLLLLLFWASSSFAQTERFTPDSQFVVDYWHISPKTELYVGASFFYTDPNDSIIVWLESCESDAIGNLYFMVPGYTDSAFFLFTNKQGSARVNITDTLQSLISPGTEIFFMYSRQGTPNHRYTGQNRTGIDPENKLHYPLSSFVARDFGERPGFGHRWSVAGKIVDNNNVTTDTIVFGFEDDRVNLPFKPDSCVSADFDFNDVIFKVTGLHLNVEKSPDSIALVQDNLNVRAGDTVTFKAEIWADSLGTKVRAPQFDSLVTWTFTGKKINGDTILPDQKKSIVRLVSKTTHEQFTLCASIISPIDHDTLSICKQIRPLPGAVNQLSIELISDTTAPGFSFNHPIQITRVQLASNASTMSAFAVLRDAFGNFVRMSRSTKWDTTTSGQPTLTPGVCSVASGDTTLGQGIITRGTGSGDMQIYASSTIDSKQFSDSLFVNVASVSYKSIRISNRPISSSSLPSLKISTDNCTILVAIGLRVDNDKWETIPVIWTSQKWLKTPNSLSDSVYNFCPVDTGNGFIEITYQNFLHYKLPVTALPGAPYSMKLYLKDGKLLPNDTTIIAGKPISLSAHIFDKHGIRLKEETLSGSTSWNIVEKQVVTVNDSSGMIINRGAFASDYYPIRAYRTVMVHADFGGLQDSVQFKVSPGNPYRVVIESHADPQKSLNVPAEINLIEIPDNRTQATVFAIVRDSMGNFIDSLRNGTWGSIDTTVTIQSDPFPYKGTIIKNLSLVSGSGKVFVTSGNFSDTANVVLLPYHYVDLKITTPDNYPLQMLTISTNDDTTLITRGLRSDTALWKDVPSDWFASQTVDLFPKPLSGAIRYSFSPVKPGQGVVIAHLSGTEELYDTISVNCTRGKPVRSELIVITPHEKLIAGDSLSAIVKIYNKDGLVPGSYCFPSEKGVAIKYGDVLGYGSSAFRPVIISSKGSSIINVVPLMKAGLNQCFNDGIDTVHFILYNAPYSNDSLHRLVVNFDTVMSFSSTFRLKPAALRSLKLAHTLPCCPDSLTLRHLGDQVFIYSVGYDLYGNMRGSEPCQWSVNGTLHALKDSSNISRILYTSDPKIVINDENGLLIAHSSNNKVIADTLKISVLGPRSNVLSAITGDLNGNGLLDIIRVTFDRQIFLGKSLRLSKFIVTFRSTNFTVDSLTLSTDNRLLSLYLAEQRSSTMQTGWTPQLFFNNSDYSLIKAPDTISVTTSDGAGPVIESIVKEIKDNDRENDLITVTFSERISGPNGAIFSVLQLPEKVFNTWRLISSDSMLQLNVLSGIPRFNDPLKQDQLFFNTSNGFELTNRHYFNIRTDSKSYIITDRYNNRPHINNRKVNVEIQGNVFEEMKVFPNPSRATEAREPAGQFHLKHNPYAIDWVAADRAGFVMQFQLKLPENVKSNVKGQITILDAIGNTVCTDPEVHLKWKNLVSDGPVVTSNVNKNILPSSWTNDGTIYHYYVYWNGYAGNKKQVSPGMYKVVLKVIIETEGSKANTVVYSGLIGIKP